VQEQQPNKVFLKEKALIIGPQKKYSLIFFPMTFPLQFASLNSEKIRGLMSPWSMNMVSALLSV